MSQIWKPIDELELYLDIEDYETSKVYQDAFEKMSDDKKNNEKSRKWQ
jgi:hypothetical protein